ncbi:unnamed protein product [Moneuplotes crassus]|uniref:Uncharacterized protein n=1 Tax=Euplotes crassus TaxID=5936 RepID=A0AAD1Y8C8_EUPCR|nr:unnamed protein product [Moneuplotes crassus]
MSLLNEAKIKIKALADLSSNEEIEDDSMVSKNRLQKIKEAIENSEVSNSLNSSKTSTTSILPTQHGKFLKRTQKMSAKEIKRFIEKHKNDPNFPESASKRDEIINAQISALLKLREPRSQPNIPRPPQNKIMSPTKRTQTNLSNKKPLGFSYLKMLGSSKDERGRRRTDFQPQVPSSPLNLSFSNQKSIQKSTVSSKNQSFSSNHSRGTSNSKKQWAINKALGKSPNSKGIKMLGDIGKGNTLGKAMMGHLKNFMEEKDQHDNPIGAEEEASGSEKYGYSREEFSEPQSHILSYESKVDHLENLGKAPVIDIDAEINRDKELRKQMIYMKYKQRNENIRENAKYRPGKLKNYFGTYSQKKVRKPKNKNFDYTQNFTPYHSKILVLKPSIKNPGRTKKERKAAENFQERKNPVILQKEFYFTDKILHNKTSDRLAHLKGGLCSLLETGSTQDYNDKFF